jgi:GntR family transcriptional regulator / MocR family aminotransferase
MDLFLGRDEGPPLAAQLYEQLRLSIITGRLHPGDKLPPSRQLASQLGTSRHTVTTAYDRLVAEGYVEGHAGGGSVVTWATEAPQRPAGRAAVLRPAPRTEGWAPSLRPSSRCRFDLRPGLPDPALFPVAAWRRRLAAAVTPGRSLLYGDPAGDARLRRAVAAWVARSRSVVASKETVIVTCGAQHAIDLVARILLEPGDQVAVEDPGYAPVARLFEAQGAEVTGVPVDDQGLVVDELPPAARIVYVTPSHQYPLGMTMSMPRRRALLRWAAERNAAVIEDDYDTEFRYVDRPLEPIQRLDEHGRVVYVGSFSKTFSPAVRLGFAVLPEPLAQTVAALRQCSDWHPPAATQAAMAGFIADGLLEKHIRRCRLIYAERCRLLTDALSGPLAPYLTGLAANAGLHITAELRGGLREDQVLQAAQRRGVAAFGMHDCFRAYPPSQGLLLGFGAVTTADLPAAVRELRGALESCAS